MYDLIYQGVLNSLLVSDTHTALHLLQEHQANLLDPIDGVVLHAEVLYCAIKNANKEIVQYLMSLPVLSDIAFFKFCGQTPLSLAIEEDQRVLIPLLLRKADKNFALHMAVQQNLTKTVKFLLSKCVFKQKLLKFLALS